MRGSTVLKFLSHIKRQRFQNYTSCKDFFLLNIGMHSLHKNKLPNKIVRKMDINVM